MSTPARSGVALVLSDDWELRGDGSGNMRSLQFATLRRLCDVYEEHGLRGTFNAEVFQQLAHRRLGAAHPELAELADEWEAAVREAHRRGHDVQLHLHPQWRDATYDGGGWRLAGSWSLIDYPGSEMASMLGAAKDHLEGVLRRDAPDYRCVSFRGGSWSLAPSADALRVLTELGIAFDMSIAEGVYLDSVEIRLDYREVQESFLPFYPDPSDARRVAATPQPIVCVPTHTFRKGLGGVVATALVRRWRSLPVGPPRRLRDRHLPPNAVPVPDSGHISDYSQRTRQSTSQDAPRESRHVVSNLCELSFRQMREMLDDIRRRAEATGWPLVPVILENHTKDIGNFDPFERFAALVAREPDIEVITATELADGLAAGRFPVKTRDD